MTNFNSNEQAVKLIDGCVFEVPYLFSVDGMEFKGKVDGVGDGYLLEIKTSSQATTAVEFREEAQERHYDMQAAMYLIAHQDNDKLLKAADHYFLVINTQAPFKVSVYKSSPAFIQSGVNKICEAVNSYRRFIINGEKYEKGIETI
jgi:uncharacterized protein YdbL (DUF1318 family)